MRALVTTESTTPMPTLASVDADRVTIASASACEASTRHARHRLRVLSPTVLRPGPGSKGKLAVGGEGGKGGKGHRGKGKPAVGGEDGDRGSKGKGIVMRGSIASRELPCMNIKLHRDALHHEAGVPFSLESLRKKDETGRWFVPAMNLLAATRKFDFLDSQTQTSCLVPSWTLPLLLAVGSKTLQRC